MSASEDNRATESTAVTTAPADRSMSIAWLCVILLAGGVFLLFLRGLAREGEPHPAVGKTLTMVDLQPLTGEGEAVGLDDLQGKVTLINFWGPWCPPCLVELPHLVKLRQRLSHEDDLQVLLVASNGDYQPLQPPALGWTEDVATLKEDTAAELNVRNLDAPTYVDIRGRTRDAFASIAGWNGYPTSLLLDRDGVIREVWLGFSPGQESRMEGRVLELLKEDKQNAVERSTARRE